MQIVGNSTRLIKVGGKLKFIDCTSMNIYSDNGDYIIDLFLYKTELSATQQ